MSTIQLLPNQNFSQEKNLTSFDSTVFPRYIFYELPFMINEDLSHVTYLVGQERDREIRRDREKEERKYQCKVGISIERVMCLSLGLKILILLIPCKCTSFSSLLFLSGNSFNQILHLFILLFFCLQYGLGD